MLARALIVIAALASAYALYRLWKRPPRRLSTLGLTELGIGGPAIVQFSTENCPPCRAATPHLEAAARQAEVPYRQIDVGESPDVARRYGIRTVPTIVVTGAGGLVVSTWTVLPSNGEVAAAARRARRLA